MNIKKTNMAGLYLIDKRNGVNLDKTINYNNKHTVNGKMLTVDEPDMVEAEQYITVRKGILNLRKHDKVIRLSANVFEACKKIDYKTILDDVNYLDFDINSIVILLPNDDEGIVKIERMGSDFGFLYFRDLRGDSKTDYIFNSFSYLTKEFMLESGGDDKHIPLKILTYLFYGDISTKYITSGHKTKLSFYKTIHNNSNHNITFIDTTWKQRICVDGFTVSGHFRMQRHGKGNSLKKLIWIEEFSKNGYNKKAGKELNPI